MALLAYVSRQPCFKMVALMSYFKFGAVFAVGVKMVANLRICGF